MEPDGRVADPFADIGSPIGGSKKSGARGGGHIVTKQDGALWEKRRV